MKAHHLIAGAVLIVVLAVLLFVIPAPEKSPESQVVSYEEETATTTIDVTYKTFGISTIDTAFENVVDGYVRDFKAQAVTFGASPTNRPYVLAVEGQAYATTATTAGIQFLVYKDFGGAHGLPQLLGVNIDRESGEVVTLTETLERISLSLDELAQAAQTHFAQELGDSLYMEGLAPEEENFSSFLIASDAVTFYFQPYQIAAYALGAHELSIGY